MKRRLSLCGAHRGVVCCGASAGSNVVQVNVTRVCDNYVPASCKGQCTLQAVDDILAAQASGDGSKQRQVLAILVPALVVPIGALAALGRALLVQLCCVVHPNCPCMCVVASACTRVGPAMFGRIPAGVHLDVRRQLCLACTWTPCLQLSCWRQRWASISGTASARRRRQPACWSSSRRRTSCMRSWRREVQGALGQAAQDWTAAKAAGARSNSCPTGLVALLGCWGIPWTCEWGVSGQSTQLWPCAMTAHARFVVASAAQGP